jgi:hypothetical protein
LIGSAMGMVKINFFWYMRRIAPLAAAVYLVQMAIMK